MTHQFALDAHNFKCPNMNLLELKRGQVAPLECSPGVQGDLKNLKLQENLFAKTYSVIFRPFCKRWLYRPHLPSL